MTQIQYNVKLIHDFSTYMTASYPSSDCQNGVSSARFSRQTPCQHFDQAQAEELRQQQKRSEDAEVQVLNFRRFTCRFFMFLLHSEDGSLMISGKWLVLSDQHLLRISQRNSGKPTGKPKKTRGERLNWRVFQGSREFFYGISLGSVHFSKKRSWC